MKVIITLIEIALFFVYYWFFHHLMHAPSWGAVGFACVLSAQIRHSIER